jgi:hypothetical protein
MTEPASASTGVPACEPILSIVLYFLMPAPFLNESLATIVPQLGPDTEFIVVAGHAAGTDLGIDPQYRRYIDHLIVEPDPGAWDAANKGWRKARGRWVQFVMSDDVLPEGSVAASLAELNDRAGDMVTGGLSFYQCDRAGRPNLISHHRGRALSLDRVLGELRSPAVLYRRALLEQLGGFDGRYAYSHDRELLLRAWQANVRSEIFAHDVYAMRVHADSRTLSGNTSIVLTYLKEHLAFAGDALQQDGISAEAARAIRRWRDEELLKYRILRAMVRPADDTAPAERLSLMRTLAAALRISQRKFLRKLRRKTYPPLDSILELRG